MPATGRATRRHIVESSYRLFYREGFQRSGMDAIAEAAGVTKRTLYNHFPSKDHLIAAVLEAQTSLAEAEIRRWCHDGLETPGQLVAGIFQELRKWSRTPDWRGSGFTRAAMELAWAPGHPGRAAAATQKRAVERILAEALGRTAAVQPDRLARELLVLIEGANTLHLIHGDGAWFDIAEAAAHALTHADVPTPEVSRERRR